VSTLPASVRESIEVAAANRGLGTSIRSAAPVGGGCIHQGTRLTFESDATAFVKWSTSVPKGMFEAEAAGLAALRGASQDAGAGLVIPEVLGYGSTPEGSWLMLEYVAPGRESPESDEALGRGLALLHGVATAGDFGWSEDNWIGSLPQSNSSNDSWSGFWITERIEPQLERARRAGACRAEAFDRLLCALPAALGGLRSPTLLHGDLWSGNAFTSSTGRPVLIDPAVYRGDGEVDLAMTELFGGFAPRLYSSYSEIRPIGSEYRAFRRDAYQLYYLLAHVNLFGGGYEAGARAAAERVVAALG
jgi:fructosamine-3-kinase